MRSHNHSLSSDVEEKVLLEGSRGQVDMVFGYSLRENPKKTSRLSDFVADDLAPSTKQCKRCGKMFPSLKSLFGHMRCHCEKTSYRRSFEEKEEGSWDEEKDSLHSFCDENEPSPCRIPAVPRRKRRSKRASPASITGYETEQANVAIILMMLSRDIGEFSDNLSEGASADELKRRKNLSTSELGKKRAMPDDNGYPENEFNILESRYKCLTCKKGFHSYHALGGHRASHKRIRNCYRESPSFHTEASVKSLGVVDQASRIHRCDICGKVFSSGQALGGHKRSHFVSNVAARGRGGDHHNIHLPASMVVGSNNLKTWWAEVNLKHEQNLESSISD